MTAIQDQSEHRVVDLLGHRRVVSLVLGLDDRADPRRIHQRWAHLRFELAAAGAPEEDLAALDAEVARAMTRPGERTLLAFASDGAVLVRRVLERTVRPDAAVVGAPEVLPLLEAEQGRVHYLLVIADRTGADLWRGVWPEPAVPVRSVELPDDEVHPVNAGGWAGLAMSHIQRRVLDSWHHNAEAVASAVVHEATRAATDAVVLCGDTQSTVLVQRALPQQVATRAAVLRQGGTRGSGGIGASVAAQVDAVLAGVAMARVDRALQQWAQAVGQGHRAVQGWSSTASAVAAADVGTLLMDAGVGAGTAPLVLGALVTGADVVVVPEDHGMDFDDGVAALLRHD